MRRFLLLLFVAALTACSTPPAPEMTPLHLPAVAPSLTPPAAASTPAGSLTLTPKSCKTSTYAAQAMTAVAAGATDLAAVESSPALTATPSEACMGESVCILNGHFFFQRPIPPTATQAVDRTYPYGGTQNGTREVHHGVEFYNAQGTPVLAAADGEVVFAGNDKLTLIAWVTSFYGNVIVLKHQLAGETFFTVYGHLYKIDVTVGQAVKAGEQIGEVGATGTAIGSHLHFEVRRGTNDYKSTRNPELWLAPLPGTGVLAGRLANEAGSPVKGMVNIQRIESGTLNPLSVGAVPTYPRETINADDVWQENFLLGGLAAGQYRLSLVHNGAVLEQVVQIEAGKLTFVNFVVK